MGLSHFISKHYGITIKELDQPLLMHRPKERAKPGGKVRLSSISCLIIDDQDSRLSSEFLHQNATLWLQYVLTMSIFFQANNYCNIKLMFFYAGDTLA